MQESAVTTLLLWFYLLFRKAHCIIFKIALPTESNRPEDITQKKSIAGLVLLLMVYYSVC